MTLHDQLKPVMHRLEGKIEYRQYIDFEYEAEPRPGAPWHWRHREQLLNEDLPESVVAAIAETTLQRIVDEYERTHPECDSKPLIYRATNGDRKSWWVRSLHGGPPSMYPTRLVALIAAVEEMER